MILFNSSFHKTTLTNPDGEELIIVGGIIQNIVKGGSSKIPENGHVLSVQLKHPLFGTFEIGAPLSFTFKTIPQIENTSSKNWDSFEYILGGTPLLVYNGLKIKDFEFEETIPSFLRDKRARTALGILPNGNWIFVVVDKTSLFDGMTIDELADFMIKLGCLFALNLDGGGSSTMVYEGLVKNNLCGEKINDKQTHRLVSDAILILEKK
ncbi:MAG: phosphodiester glycosidase family protein [Verrucomicrobia bacterium]|nr:phosphodiester glycosidase family protein [Verrucomicrobiota bacterium]